MNEAANVETQEDKGIVKQTPEARLDALGFKAAAAKVVEKRSMKRKLMIAYEFYRVVSQAHIDAFNLKLRRSTQSGGSFGSYQTLAFTPVAQYMEVPPAEVLAELEVALSRKCFDRYEVAHIVDVHDPLLFGRIEGCPDRFYIAQWDDDVKITDLLKDHEG